MVNYELSQYVSMMAFTINKSNKHIYNYFQTCPGKIVIGIATGKQTILITMQYLILLLIFGHLLGHSALQLSHALCN